MPWTVDEMAFLVCVYHMDPSQLNFHPGYFKTPSFTVYLLAASLAFSAMLGWVHLVQDKAFYIQHMDQRGNMFLVGRLNSVVFAVLTVWILYFFVRRLYPDRPHWVALLAAALLAILAGHVVWSHYLSQHPLVTFWVLLTFYLLLRLLENRKPHWYVLSGLSVGIAASTNYNGVLLAALIILAHFLTADGRCRTRVKDPNPRTRLRWRDVRWLIVALVCVLFGFLLVTPYALLDAHFFWDEFMWEFRAVQSTTLASLADALHYVLITLLPAGSGWCLYLIGMAGLLWLSVRRSWRGGEVLVLAWVYLYLLLTVRAGSFATVSRALPLLVCFPILATNLLFELRERWPGKGRCLARAFGILLILTTAILTGFVDGFFLTDTVRRDASAWILEHVPPGTSSCSIR
jgi:4-amino-4-deoxy-L-arabinose transferase-like glycosyltransferase